MFNIREGYLNKKEASADLAMREQEGASILLARRREENIPLVPFSTERHWQWCDNPTPHNSCTQN